nr:conotoxin precursor O1 [Conus judaeus]
MKLTCMIIVVLCLMACQLVTADYPRGVLPASDHLGNVAASAKSSDPNFGRGCCCTSDCCPCDD